MQIIGAIINQHDALDIAEELTHEYQERFEVSDDKGKWQVRANLEFDALVAAQAFAKGYARGIEAL